MINSLADFDNAFIDLMIERGYSESEAIDILDSNGLTIYEIQKDCNYNPGESLERALCALSK